MKAASFQVSTLTDLLYSVICVCACVCVHVCVHVEHLLSDIRRYSNILTW